MRSARLTAVALGLLVSCGPDATRRANETGMVPDTTRSTTGDAAVADAGGASPAEILSQLQVANSAEIQLGKLAVTQATSPEVRRVAKLLATDHAKNQEQLKALAQKLSVRLIPPAGGSVSAVDSAALPPAVQGKSGADLDRAFLGHEIREHRSHIEKIRNQLLPAAQNSQLKTYLQKTLAEMQDHLNNLEQVLQQISN